MLVDFGVITLLGGPDEVGVVHMISIVTANIYYVYNIYVFIPSLSLLNKIMCHQFFYWPVIYVMCV